MRKCRQFFTVQASLWLSTSTELRRGRGNESAGWSGGGGDGEADDEPEESQLEEESEAGEGDGSGLVPHTFNVALAFESLASTCSYTLKSPRRQKSPEWRCCSHASSSVLRQNLSMVNRSTSRVCSG